MSAEIHSEADRNREEAADQKFHMQSYKGTSPIKVKKLGHLVYEVSDIECSVKFWTEVMGFKETDRNAYGMVFFRCNADHHAIGLKPGQGKTGRNIKSGLQVEHLAMEVDSVDVLLKARAYLKQNNNPDRL
jgi:catechol 2,3-dioxygenase